MRSRARSTSSLRPGSMSVSVRRAVRIACRSHADTVIPFLAATVLISASS